MPIEIRPIDTVEAVEHFQRLEVLIWGSPPEDVVPLHVVITAVRNGGGCLGAYAEDGPAETGGMVGLTFWFPGLGVPTNGPGRGRRQWKMCSHMAGVLPDRQGLGIGLQLKLAQRAAILAQGMTQWVTWTYDPLLRTNAVFNIHRLGAVCNVYRPEFYGMMRDELNAGTPSDRLQVDWWLASERVQRRIAGGETPRNMRTMGEWKPDASSGELATDPDLVVWPTARTAAGHVAPVDEEISYTGRMLAIPIPDDIAAVRRVDSGLGLEWRMFMRRVLETAFGQGYLLTDCVHLGESGWHYLLQPPMGDTMA